MKIVTGRTGTPHVTSQQQRDIYSAIFGNKNIVLNIGKCLKAELQASNTVRVYDGALVIQGCVATIDAGAYDDVRIDNGTQGQKRIDIIVAHYKNNTGTGYESVELEVIKGKSDAKPTEPSVPEGVIRNGSNDAYFPIYAVFLNGITIEKVEQKFKVLTSSIQNLNILWEGAFYMMPTEEQTINLSEENAISKQNNGVIFAFCAFDRNTLKPKDTEWMYFFVPKSHVQLTKNAGTATTGIYMSDAYAGLYKYLYVEDRKIRGFSSNSEAGTVNGIEYRNNDFVLRYVIGV